MSRHSSYTTTYDEAIQINISKIKEWGYLKPGQIKSGSLTWSRDGSITDTVGIKVNTASVSPYLELDYQVSGLRVNYRIQLVSIPSNLGSGHVWYFLCPVTRRRCRKLYSVGPEFLHREAYQDCIYESQRRSHKERELTKLNEKLYAEIKAYEQILTKHYKSHYAEKPTKRHLKMLKKIAEAKGFSTSDLIGFQPVRKEI